MRRSVREGWPGLRLPPLLLDGPPGIGKSHWARRLGALLSAPVTVIEATGESASFGVVGSQRGWGGAHPGRPIETVLQTLIGNPVIVVDEVEKAGTITSNKGTAYGLTEGLLPLLEPLSARRWSCPYYQVKFDMSWVGWVMTSNDYRRLPAPLLSRCPPLRLQALTLTELIGFARRQGGARGLSETALATLSRCWKALQCGRITLACARSSGCWTGPLIFRTPRPSTNARDDGARRRARMNMKGNDMSEDDLIAPGARRIMRAYPSVYGTGPRTIRNSLLGDGFLCGPGWYPLIERLSADLAEIVREDGLKRFRVVQVKEKFGGLRFYVKGGNERALDRIAEAVQEAERTCEGCGAPSSIRSIDGWLTKVCDDCRLRGR